MYVHMCLCHIYTCSTHTHPFTFENPKWLTAYHLPLAAVTNYHEVSSLKATQIDYLMVLEVRCLQWLSLGRNWGVGMPWFRSASLRRGSTFYLSQLLEDPCILWFLGPFYLQSQQWPAKLSHDAITLDLTTLLLLFPPFKGPSGYIGTMQIIQDNLLIFSSADQQPELHLHVWFSLCHVI